MSGSGWTFDGNPVSVPHTWNAVDGADGLNTMRKNPGTSVGSPSYCRGARTYERPLPSPKDGKRYFIRCEGVSSKCELSVNGEVVGYHYGAFTAFCFEITDYLVPAGNVLKIVADNSYDRQVPPISGDFSMFGGVYRDVWLIETDQVCISPLEYGGSGVILEPDPKTGKVVARVSVLGDKDEVQEFSFPNPELWSPENPKLYTVRIRIDRPGGKDEITETFGFRHVEFRPDGFYLNGKRRQIRGVGKHQDRDGKGWAVSEADLAEDVAWLKKMGADGLRTAHYPHATKLYDLCDRAGIMVWTEIPAIDELEFTETFRSNLLQVAKEMVAQHRNHPSVVMWGLFNELFGEGGKNMPMNKVVKLMGEVQDEIHAVDPTRPVTAATCDASRTEINALTDSLGFNLYPGWYDWKPWYWGTGDDMANAIGRVLKETPSRRTIAMSEYGGGASVNQHADPFYRTQVGSGFYPEEYQASLHVGAFRALKDNPKIWGIFPWNMFDLAADRRHEADRHGINNKGLVTYDRQTAKDAFYLYKANWKAEPELHLVGSRMTETTNATMNVMAFSNVGPVTLTINGQSIGTAIPDSVMTCLWREVPLAVGRNEVRISAGGLTRKAVWERRHVEPAYAFRRELDVVHRLNRRDWSLKPTADEFAFVDGMRVGDADLAEYLIESMGVKPGTKTVLKTRVDSTLREREYEIEVSALGVSVRGFDTRAVAQALYHLEDLMNIRRAPFLKIGKERRRSLFSPRMAHSGWGLDLFPDAHLRQMAHAGIDAILIFLTGVDATQGGGANARVNDIIERALGFGLDTYLYSKVSSFAHPDDPDGAEKLRDSFGRVAAAHPKAKGIVFVGESCQFPSRDPRVQPVRHQDKDLADPRPLAGWFPCRDYPDWLKAVQVALREHAPDMEIVFWTYNWSRQPVELCADLVGKFPDGVAILSTFGKGEPVTHRNGLVNDCRDYTISCPGPTRHFAAEAKAAGTHARKLYAMSNTGGLTWDFGVIPYQPCPYQWKRRWDALRESNAREGLCGLMESHHYGWWPSFVSELAKEAFTEGGLPFEEHIRLIAARDFGDGNVEKVLAVWKRWSVAADDAVATNENQYGPFRLGPAYPFSVGGRPLEEAEFPQEKGATHPMRWMAYLNYPYGQSAADRLNIVYSALPESARACEMELLQGAEAAYFEGGKTLREIARLLDASRRAEAERMAGLGEFMARTVRTAINLRLGEDALRRGDRAAFLRVCRAERENAMAALPLVEADSRLGWEPSMLYVGGPEQIRWKLQRINKTIQQNERKN